ncbi:hypothetical protein D1818_12615 [Aquimarina sp. BL5]|uniref:hypothetical protein n=1 Tax=Aquimarina sp. BL5 TaxID=1714860 RepID=UPI000E4CC1DF|nr:hypothetical protein [Aquimarina sp. BL5]AXT51637.1 hypothetical protein D1818_12615 [Aquimarina sp. BL5]RKN08535.1 hypothetical protein D7036_05565 [Aquimarina sp. BL5]
MATATDTSKAPVETTKTISPKPEIVPGISKEIIDELSNEINNMLSFAIYNGITINTEVNTLIQNSSVDDLINAHNLLCKNIAPATPKSIEYTKKLYRQGKEKTLFSTLPLVRNLIFLSLFFLAAFIITGLSPDVNNDSLDKGIMDNQGIPLLLNLGFLTAISGLGVLFYLLKSVSVAVKNGTLVPEDTIYYIALIVLGIIAGLISSEIISFYQKDAQDINLFNKGLMALIGGFSSDAIFSILQGIIDRIKAIFIPSSSAS